MQAIVGIGRIVDWACLDGDTERTGRKSAASLDANCGTAGLGIRGEVFRSPAGITNLPDSETILLVGSCNELFIAGLRNWGAVFLDRNRFGNEGNRASDKNYFTR